MAGIATSPSMGIAGLWLGKHIDWMGKRLSLRQAAFLR
jgi:hypothetical protein